MEIIKRKILLEENIDRNYNSPTYGQLTASTFYINVFLTQNMDDMGMFTDIIYLPNFSGINMPANYSILKDKLNDLGVTFPFMSGVGPITSASSINPDIRVTGTTILDYYNTPNNILSAYTDSKIEDVRAYNSQQPYRTNFNTNTETYINYTGGTVNGVDRVTGLGTATTYVFGVDNNDPDIGTNKQKSGLLYVDTPNNTTVSYITQGWNETNISLAAITKEEYLFGIISKPEVKNDVFIDRGITTIFEKHLKLSEIKNLDELTRYGKGYFNLTID